MTRSYSACNRDLGIIQRVHFTQRAAARRAAVRERGLYADSPSAFPSASEFAILEPKFKRHKRHQQRIATTGGGGQVRKTRGHGLAHLRFLPEVLSEPGRRIVCFERRPDGIFCARQQSTLVLRQLGGEELDGAKFVCAREFMESRYQFG